MTTYRAFKEITNAANAARRMHLVLTSAADALALALCGWIPVEMEKPDADQAVMIAGHSPDEPVWMGYFDGENWNDFSGNLLVNGDLDLISPTHWMPLPEPPPVKKGGAK